MTEDAARPDAFTSPYFRFRSFAAGDDDLDRLFALRYQVYCLERSFLPPADYPSGLERDEYDAFSTHVAAYSLADILVGAIRLVTPPDGGRFPFQAHCTRLFAGRPRPPDRECAELSRLVISKLYRRRAGDTVFGVSSQLLEGTAPPENAGDRRKAQRGGNDRRNLQPDILLGIFRQAYRHCKRQGIGHLYMALEKPLMRLLERLFYFSLEPIGELVDYYGPVIPCILPMGHFDRALSRGDPVLFAWFQDALEDGFQTQCC
jgi:N-acyl amino acid synthase of PEP-CTERM/exosortase system